MRKLLMMIGAAADLTAKALAAAAVGAMLPLSAMADAVRVYDVDDYVQDGLVLHFDGIRNAGATAAHDPNATTWKNLVDDSHDATKTTFASPANASTAGSWAGNGYVFGGRDYFAIDSLSLGDEVTVQSMVDYDNSNQVGTWPVLFGATSANSDSFVVFVYKQAGYQINFKLFGKPSHSMKPTWSPPYVTAIYDNANGRISIDNAVTSVWQTANSGVSGNLGDWTYAIGTGQNSDTEKKKRIFMGTYHSLRVYTNVLSNSELAWNRQVDDARYRTAQSMGKGNDDVNVIVASNVEGVEGADECGKWHIAEGTHTFTAPATRIVGKIGYTLNGYTIQTWNGTEWGAAVTNSGASYTASASDAKVRLTWLWTPTLRAASNYDVDDYVQDGLVLHFDGIRNAGATVAHNSTQRTWKNLVKGQPDATFSSENGYWTDDGKGFYFEGVDKVCYAAITNPISVGPNATVQLAVNVDPSNQNNGKSANSTYPCYFHAGTDSDTGIFQYLVGKYTKHLQFKHLGWTGNSVSMSQSKDDWDGRYASAIVADAKVYFTTTGADLETAGSVDRGSFKSLSAKYCWGGSPRSGMRAVLGSYYSVRVYNKALSNDELAQNRRVDEMRFRGIGDIEVVNGAVGETGETGESSLPDGVYNIETGTWTITAPEIKSGGHTYKAKLFVERYNATSGKWEATMAKPQWTESYVVDKSALGNSRIRLTWTWEMRKGLNIIIR